IVPHVATRAEFEAMPLDPFRVIYLANLDRLSPARRESLEQWVRQGGGLVIALGDQLIDVPGFNAQMYRNGQGLSPVEVQALRGDEREEKWANFNITAKDHPVV